MLSRFFLPCLLFIIWAASATADDYSKLFAQTDPAVAVLYYAEKQPTANPLSPQASSRGLGSGVLIDTEGHIITAAHVVQTADAIAAEFSNGFGASAKVIASNPQKDVALLKLVRPPEGIEPATLGDSDAVKVGQEVFVIGAPLGLAHTLTIGHISARHTKPSALTSDIQAELFQTDAAINKGNSGGPMFNKAGEVIGIVSFIRSPSGGSAGLGFAVTSNAAHQALFVERAPWNGMSGMLLSGELAALFNLPQPMGYLVQKVAANSPSEKIGLRPSLLPISIAGQELFVGGDIILSLDGIPMSGTLRQDYRAKHPAPRPGQMIELRVLRAGKIHTIRVPAP